MAASWEGQGRCTEETGCRYYGGPGVPCPESPCEPRRSAAEALRLIAKDLRAAGDVRQVRLSGDGVTEEYVTVADELWLIALSLDGRMSNEVET